MRATSSKSCMSKCRRTVLNKYQFGFCSLFFRVKHDFIVISINSLGHVCFRCRLKKTIQSYPARIIATDPYLLAYFDDYDQAQIKQIVQDFPVKT